MSITLQCAETGRTADLRMMSFFRFRAWVATRLSPKFGAHYASLLGLCRSYGPDRKALFAAHDAKTRELVESGEIDRDIVDFLYEPDCGGEIPPETAKKVLAVVEAGGAEKCDVYPAKWSDVVGVLNDCVTRNVRMTWS